MVRQLDEYDQASKGYDQDGRNELERFCPEPYPIVQKVVDDVAQVQHQKHYPGQVQKPSVLLLRRFSRQDRYVLDRTGRKR